MSRSTGGDVAGAATAAAGSTRFYRLALLPGPSTGVGLAGVLVVRDDLEPVGAARSLVRTLAWPLRIAAFAAKQLGTTAKVVMIRSANPFRVEMARAYGLSIQLAALHSARAKLALGRGSVPDAHLDVQLSLELAPDRPPGMGDARLRRDVVLGGRSGAGMGG